MYFSDKGLSSLLKTQTELEFLHLKLGSVHISLTDKCLTTLHSPKLTSVKLEALDQVSNNGIITLAKNCPNICELMVPRCNSLTDVCFQTVSTLLKGRLVSLLVHPIQALGYHYFELFNTCTYKQIVLTESPMNTPYIHLAIVASFKVFIFLSQGLRLISAGSTSL